MKQEIKICKGLPASGKSTYSKKFCEDNPNYVRVCRDDFRNMRGRYLLPKQEKLITLWEHGCIRSALQSGLSVIVDATNLNPEYFNAIINIAKEFNITTSIEDFTHITPEECIERDLKRLNSVGAKIIWHFYDKYLRPKYNVIKDNTLMKAIICDLDGTLCLHNGRSPYDVDKCDQDLINFQVGDILWKYNHTHKILFVSGREDKFRDKTILWLKRNFLHNLFYDLHMRKTGDNRNDAIVKREIFMEHINGKYYIDFVLDDRNRVVDMWRKDLGLQCWQVNYGDF